MQILLQNQSEICPESVKNSTFCCFFQNIKNHFFNPYSFKNVVTCNNTHSMLTNSPVLYMIFVMGLEEDLEGSGEMEGMLEEVEEYRKRWRFQFNEKSKVMVVSKRKKERRTWWLGAKEVEEMEAYKYLGVWFYVQLSGRVHPNNTVASACK